MKTALSVLSFVGLVAAAAPASAVAVGGYTFNPNAFADTVISSSGTFSTSGGTLSSVLTDTDAGTYAFSFTTGAFVEMGFTDNTLVNGAGADLVLFDLGVPDSFKLSITIGGTMLSYASVATGESAGGFPLNAVAIELGDFGIASGASLSSIVIGLDFIGSEGTVPSLSLVGALNSGDVGNVPEPATLLLTGLALGGLGVSSRRKQQAR